MEHAVTVEMIVDAVLVLGGLIGIPAICFFLIWLFNPFRTGH